MTFYRKRAEATKDRSGSARPGTRETKAMLDANVEQQVDFMHFLLCKCDFRFLLSMSIDGELNLSAAACLVC